MGRAGALVGIVAAALCPPRTAEACSPPRCGPGFFVPAASSTVPANLPALTWRSQASYENQGPRDPALVKLTTIADPATPLPITTMLVRSSSFTSDWLIVPDQPLVEGTSYTATDSNLCQPTFYSPPTSTFHVGPTAPLPVQLGTLTLAPNEVGVLEVWTASGACTAPADVVSAGVQLELSADAAPWRDALHLETLVDGHPWTGGNFDDSYQPPGTNGRGRGKDVVFQICHTDDPGVLAGLGPGAHAVAMRATLPGTSLLLTTPAVSVTLACPPAPIAPDVTDVTDPPEQTGCGCASSDTSSLAPLAIALLVLGGRRRRATRSAPEPRRT